MKIKFLSLIALVAILFTVSCGKDDDNTGTIVIETPDETEEPVFIAADPDINAGVITFETTGPSFDLANAQPDDRSQGNWGFFGTVGENSITVSYSANPDATGVNTSGNVIKVTEPVGVESWAGFYFMLENAITFPSGQEAIALDFYSPAAGHNVLLKLEDGLANGTDGKKSTGDLFAVTTGTGWETLVFNIPEKNGERNGIYNTVTMILGYNVTNAAEVSYHVDNFRFSTPAEVVIAAAPTTAPSLPTYDPSSVISIFSDQYPTVVSNFNPNWGQSTVVSTETIADNTVLKYENLNYQGTEITPAIDVSGKARLHIDYFSGDATTLDFFLISPDGDDEGDAPEEVAYSLDVTTAPGEWNSVDIDLSHFASVVDLSDVFQIKVAGNGTVYFDNIYFYGGGSDSGTDSVGQFDGTFGGATVNASSTYNFPSGADDWGGFANNNTDMYPLAFPHGGRITFTASAAAEDVAVYFRFERLPYPDVDPAFSTGQVTVSGSEATEYTIEIQPQDEANTFSSALMYLVTRDAEVTITNIVIREYDAPRSGTNYSPDYSGTFGGATVNASGTFNFPAGADDWGGFANNNADIYPLSFPNGGRITFNAATEGTDVEVYFRFERLPYPDVEPSFNTANTTISGTEVTAYTVEIPPQDASNTYSSALFYLVTRDANVTVTDFVITSFD